jgi:hypothetical protein
VSVDAVAPHHCVLIRLGVSDRARSCRSNCASSFLLTGVGSRTCGGLQMGRPRNAVADSIAEKAPVREALIVKRAKQLKALRFHPYPVVHIAS